MAILAKMPGWVGALEIVLGLISLMAGIWVLANPGLATLTLIFLLSTGLLFLGWRGILLGAMASFLPSWLRTANIVLGLAFALSVLVIADPGYGALTLVLLLYTARLCRNNQ